MAYGSMTIDRHSPRIGRASFSTSAINRPITSLEPIEPTVNTKVFFTACQKTRSAISVA